MILMAMMAVYQFSAVEASSTLTSIVYDGSKWSIPAEVHTAVSELRSEGHEIRMVESGVKNGLGGEPTELAGSLSAARQHGLPAIVHRTGDRFSVDAAPETGQDVIRAIK